MTSQFGGRHHSTMPVGDRDAVDVDAVMRDRDRLREALKAILKVHVTGWDNIWAGSSRCRDIARAALTPENPS